MALYCGDTLVAGDSEILSSDNSWTGANTFMSLSASDPSHLYGDQLGDSLFFAVYDGELRHFDLPTLAQALGSVGSGGGSDIGRPICDKLCLSAAEMPLKSYGTLSSQSKPDGWSVNLNIQSLCQDTKDFLLTIAHGAAVNGSSIDYGIYTEGSWPKRYGYALKPRIFLYQRVSADWTLTADAVYFDVSTAAESTCSTVKSIGVGRTYETGYRYGSYQSWTEPCGTFYLFKNEQNLFPQKLYSVQRACNYLLPWYGNCPHDSTYLPRWYGYLADSVTQKARVVYGQNTALRFKRPDFSEDFFKKEYFMENVTMQQPDQPVLLKKGDVVRMWYDCEFAVSAPLGSRGAANKKKCDQKGKIMLSLADAKEIMNIRLRGNLVPQNDASLSAKATSSGGVGQVFQLSMWEAV